MEVAALFDTVCEGHFGPASKGQEQTGPERGLSSWRARSALRQEQMPIFTAGHPPRFGHTTTHAGKEKVRAATPFLANTLNAEKRNGHIPIGSAVRQCVGDAQGFQPLCHPGETWKERRIEAVVALESE